MTESDWASCREPQQMLAFARASGRASNRNLRLFACACLRGVWHLLGDDRSRGAVDVAERHADGDVDKGELGDARRLAIDRANELHAPFGHSRAEQAKRAAYAAGKAAAEGWDALTSAAEVAIPGFQCRVLRDLFDPFRAVRLDPAWLTREVVALAEAAYEHLLLPSGHLDPQRISILSDALEDAGWTEAQVLRHLRGEGPHWQGCFAADAVLGKS